MSKATCQWRQTDDEHTPDTWQADCGTMWTFTDGGPKDNDMNFCPNCGKPLSQIDNTMTDKPDPYSSEAETQALLAPDTRTAAERKLAQMMTERGADEQGAEAYPILWEIALDLSKEQPAPTVESNSQNWKGMDGATAWHLIDRHANGWADVGKMMGEWLLSNQALAEQPAQQPLTRDQVKAMMVENGYDQASPQERADFINGIRHGEAAHNIKEQPLAKKQ